MSLMMHCGGNQATRQEVIDVPTPTHTKSWRPVPYGQVLDYVYDRVEARGLSIREEAFGLGRDGSQMFGVLSLSYANDISALSIGIRQSLDKSLALGLCSGAHVFVCDNLAFNGDFLRVIRKNTRFVWIDFKDMFNRMLEQAAREFHALQDDFTMLQEIPCDQTAGYRMIGTALGTEVLAPTQANVALREWRSPIHEEFEPRNAWSLYNAFTEGLKKGAPGSVIDRHAGAHRFFEPVLDAYSVEPVAGLLN